MFMRIFTSCVQPKMRNQILTFITFLLTLNGCFVYDNTITWQDASDVIRYVPGEKIKWNKHGLNVRLEIERKNRQLYLPFLFVEFHRNRPLYYPEVVISSMDQKIIKFYDLNIEINTIKNEPLFTKLYSDTVSLNQFKDNKYNANLWHFSTDLIPELKEIEDSILINYSLKTIDTLGIVSKIERQNVKFIRTKYRRFESFF